MMVLELKCANEHLFEGWFTNSEAFSRQKELGKIRCPICEDNQIAQALSPVTIRRHGALGSQKDEGLSPFQMARQFYKYIEENFEEVGNEFPKEALKMHYGLVEKRNIRGTSTEDEEKLLKEEGVEFFKIPLPKAEQ
jgi:hypothetical protein